MTNREDRTVGEKEVCRLNNTLADRNVLIDTLRTTLIRAESVIEKKIDQDYVFTPAAKWAMLEKLDI